MQTIIVGTTNKAKLEQISGALAPIGIIVEGMGNQADLPEVLEDGATAQENARKKAIAYAHFLGKPILSMDNALYLSGLSSEDQPGTHVRRIQGNIKSSDEELLSYYQDLVHTLGDRVEGYWEFAICFADPIGTIHETTIKTSRVFTSKRSATVVAGYPLESIQINPENGIYFSDMSPKEQTLYWQRTIGIELCTFVQSIYSGI